MKRSFSTVLLIALMSCLAACSSGNGITPIPWEGDTSLPAYTGSPAAAKPIDPANAPQNPYFASNPYSNYHNDTWMSDTYDIAGPLGKNPITWSTNLAAAKSPAATSPLFHCGTLAFDSHGRIVTICSNSAQTTAIMLNPDSLEVITSLDLPMAGDKSAGLGAGYMALDNLDRAWTPIVDQLVVVSQKGDVNNPTFAYDKFDLSSVVPTGDNINSLVPDFSGRIWFVVRYSGIIGVLDQATGAVKTLTLGEEISNSFSVNGNDAYIVSTKNLYRLTAGQDNVPYVVWSAGYKNIGTQKPGQLSAGSGTTPTILNQGNHVAIADNDDQTHIVVYRTKEQLAAGEDRVVCEVDVFEKGHGAVEDSLIGSGHSLIACNNYNYTYNQNFVDYDSEPGVARVDIAQDGNSCTKIWTNTVVNPASYGAKLSTKTGLVYVVGRKLDPSRVTADYPQGMNVWYWTAIDYQTGNTAWEQIAGTGRWFDGYWPLIFMGPNQALYEAGNGGVFAMKDSP